MVENQFVYNERSSLDFHIYCSGYGSYRTPSRDVTMLSVAGRDGDLTLDNGRFSNVDIVYKALIYKDLAVNYKDFVSFMKSQRGYKRLEDTFHPAEFRIAVFKDAIEPNLHGYDAAGFEVTFNCKPQRYLKSGEEVIEVETSGTIFNPTSFDAKPLIRAYGNGTLTVGDQILVISNISDYVDIDCEMLNAYKGSSNLNSKIAGTFPVLKAGENEISFTGTKLEIEPRWFIL